MHLGEKIKTCNEELATKLAEKAATYASIIVLQDEFTRTALEAVGGMPDLVHPGNNVDEELAGATGLDPNQLRLYLERAHLKQHLAASLSEAARMVNEAAEEARQKQQAGAANAHPAPGTPPPQACSPGRGMPGIAAYDSDGSGSETEGRDSGPEGRSRSPRSRRKLRKLGASGEKPSMESVV